MISTERKVALITGASQGIGAGLVDGFLGGGYRVVANSQTIRPDAAGPFDVLTVGGDVTDPRAAERFVGAAIDRFGRIDTLVNNAGIFVSRPYVEYAEADFAAMLSVNLAGFFQLSQRVAKRMLEQGAGHLVNLLVLRAGIRPKTRPERNNPETRL